MTKRTLDALRCELREAVQTEDVNRVVTVCEHILKWGRRGGTQRALSAPTATGSRA